jgi:hypothetical protein
MNIVAAAGSALQRPPTLRPRACCWIQRLAVFSDTPACRARSGAVSHSFCCGILMGLLPKSLADKEGAQSTTIAALAPCGRVSPLATRAAGFALESRPTWQGRAALVLFGASGREARRGPKSPGFAKTDSIQLNRSAEAKACLVSTKKWARALFARPAPALQARTDAIHSNPPHDP